MLSCFLKSWKWAYFFQRQPVSEKVASWSCLGRNPVTFSWEAASGDNIFSCKYHLIDYRYEIKTFLLSVGKICLPNPSDNYFLSSLKPLNIVFYCQKRNQSLPIILISSCQRAYLSKSSSDSFYCFSREIWVERQ